MNKLTVETFFRGLFPISDSLLLYERPRHGYGILNEFKKRLGKDVSPSLVYPFLQKLQDRGLVKFDIKRVGKKEKKEYTLTEEGNTLCEKLFRRFAALVSAAIKPWLTICTNCGCNLFNGGTPKSLEARR
ncbi:MAG: PadR family transcriptional regulator [Candidatus Heimdallarchaeota archaeon]